MMKKICALGLAFGLMASVAAPLCAMAVPTVAAETTIAPNRPIFSAVMNAARSMLTNYPYVVACMAIGAGVGYLIQLSLPVKATTVNAVTPAITAKTAQK